MYSATPIGHRYRTTDGIEWQIVRRTTLVAYPTRRYTVDFETGRQSDAYVSRRVQLRDDWLRDLTSSAYLVDNLLQAGLSELDAANLLLDAHMLRATTPR